MEALDVVVNSADSHVFEPEDLWTANIESKYKDRAVHRRLEDGYEIYEIDGITVVKSREHIQRMHTPPGAEDPRLRLKDLDNEGVWAEVIFPSRGMYIFRVRDPELELAHCRIYNDWFASEYLSVSPRFVGVAPVPGTDTGLAVQEMHRAVDLGFQGIFLPTSPPDDRPYNLEEWEPLWAACEEAGVPVTFHVGTGQENIIAHGPGGAIINYTENFYPAQRTLSHLVASGALDRHPDLKIVITEGGASWIAAVMDRMDEGARQHGQWVRPKLSMAPSEFIKRQVYATFQHDTAVLSIWGITGLQPYLFGTDYPHFEGTFGHTREYLNATFGDQPKKIREALLGGNFARLWKIPDPPYVPGDRSE